MGINGKTVFDQCSRERLEVDCPDFEDSEVIAWTYKGFGAHPIIGSHGYCTITTADNGLSMSTLGALFLSLEDAVTAMVEIADTIKADVPGNYDKIFEICKGNNSVLQTPMDMALFCRTHGGFYHALH